MVNTSETMAIFGMTQRTAVAAVRRQNNNTINLDSRIYSFSCPFDFIL